MVPQGLSTLADCGMPAVSLEDSGNVVLDSGCLGAHSTNEGPSVKPPSSKCVACLYPPMSLALSLSLSLSLSLYVSIYKKYICTYVCRYIDIKPTFAALNSRL